MAKFKIEWSSEARSDLYNILEFYLERNGTPTYSRKLRSTISKHIKHLSQNPNLGFKTNCESVRTLISGEFQIIYEIIDQTILIVMIWDLRRNPKERNLAKRVR